MTRLATIERHVVQSDGAPFVTAEAAAAVARHVYRVVTVTIAVEEGA